MGIPEDLCGRRPLSSGIQCNACQSTYLGHNLVVLSHMPGLLIRALLGGTRQGRVRQEAMRASRRRTMSLTHAAGAVAEILLKNVLWAVQRDFLCALRPPPRRHHLLPHRQHAGLCKSSPALMKRD